MRPNDAFSLFFQKSQFTHAIFCSPSDYYRNNLLRWVKRDSFTPIFVKPIQNNVL